MADVLARVSQLDRNTAITLARRANSLHTVAELDSILLAMSLERNYLGFNKKTASLALDALFKMILMFVPFVGAYYWYIYQQQDAADKKNKEKNADDIIITTRLIGWIIILVIGIMDLVIFSAKYKIDRIESEDFEKRIHFMKLLLPLIKGEKNPYDYLASPSRHILFGEINRLVINDDRNIELQIQPQNPNRH